MEKDTQRAGTRHQEIQQTEVEHLQGLPKQWQSSGDNNNGKNKSTKR